MREVIARADELAQRRLMLAKCTPPCPKCGEDKQLQIIHWVTLPTVWKCRSCGQEIREEVDAPSK